jgi:curli production assembly/transport component CsgG
LRGRGPLVLAAAALMALLAGCSTLPLGEQGSLSSGLYKPVLAPLTQPNTQLRSLPPPPHRITVAVYDFPDLTGQFKDTDNYQSLSKAVTQGGAPMLIKALQDAGDRHWFTVLDRAALNDLLKERQILTEMRKQYRGETEMNASVLPPLADAGIVLEGGIIGYDTNTMTGGLGANFLGIGGDTKWRQDTITVTLRAVSTKTSEVLAGVTVNKVVASVGLDGNVFRYVTLDKLLQGEAGITQNEPKQIAVQEAIDKAVYSLIMEGAKLGMWSFADRAAGAALVARYNSEKYGDQLTARAANPAPPVTPHPAVLAQTVALPVKARVRAVPQATVVTHPAGGAGAPSSVGGARSLPPPQASDGEPVG